MVKLFFLTLGRLSCFSDGCFPDGCFLDNCFLDDCSWNDCLPLWISQKLPSYFVDLEQIKKKYFSLWRIYLHTLFMTICRTFLHNHLSKSLLTCTHPFLLVFLICQNLFSSVRICMNIKTSKVLVFLFVKNIVTWIIFDWIMNSKCFVNTNIYHHNNITAKSWVQ